VSAALGPSWLQPLVPFEGQLAEHLERFDGSIREIARRAGCQRATICHARDGKRRLPRRCVASLARVFHLEGSNYRDFVLASHGEPHA